MNETNSSDNVQSVHPSQTLSPARKALWYVERGNWEAAHAMVQEENDRASAQVHAYLHRQEGDEWNARYWYNRSGSKPFKGSLEEELQHLLTSLRD